VRVFISVLLGYLIAKVAILLPENLTNIKQIANPAGVFTEKKWLR
jgi:hypothetical protein